jgi:PAS domain S-box-containing protein
VKISHRQAILLALFGVAALSHSWVALQEARIRSRWDSLARAELAARSERIVEFLRERGTRTLEGIREVGADPDTKALLSSEAALVQAARRPVFLDLLERFPRQGHAGAAIYDSENKPRAWSGWTPTVTMSPARTREGGREVLQIRQGNIFTVLEAVHPVLDAKGSPSGFVVAHEPLRAEFPVRNRFLRTEDRLGQLAQGAGVRADVAFEMAGPRVDVHTLRLGATKVQVEPDVALSSSTLALESGETVGRVALSGLSRTGLAHEMLHRSRNVRSWLVLVFAIALGVELWRRLRPLPILRIAMIVLARGILLRFPVLAGFDPLGMFDASWFASIRFEGLLRSPGDLLLTCAAALLAGREVKRFVLERSDVLANFGRRRAVLAIPAGVLLALLMGSLVGLHWSRIFDVARNSNATLYGALDPFTAAPVTVLLIALLCAGAAFLVWGSALLVALRGLWQKMPAWSAFALATILATLASAVKMGDPSSVSPADFIRPLPALAALAIFHALPRPRSRLSAPALLAASALVAVANFPPLLDGIEARRRELVELRAQEYGESPSGARQSLMEMVLDAFAGDEDVRTALEEGAGPRHANLAFILWAKSPLAATPAGCLIRLYDSNDQPFSTFNLGFPPELLERPVAPGSESGDARFRREEVGSDRIDVYSGSVPLAAGTHPQGRAEMSLAYFDRLGQSAYSAGSFTTLFDPQDTSEDFFRFAREIPDRVDRYQGEMLAASTDPEGGLGDRVPSVIVQELAAMPSGGRWIERRIGGQLYDLYCIRERDGEKTVGYLTFGLKRRGGLAGLSLFGRSLLVTLTLTSGLLAILTITPWIHPGLAARLNAPRFGFRERVIAGFLVVSLLPTVFLGIAGRGLFVQEKRRQFQDRLEEDLRVSRELLSHSLLDAASSAAGSKDVQALLRDSGAARTLPDPVSIDAIVVRGPDGSLRGASAGTTPFMTSVALHASIGDAPLEFFRRSGAELYACAAAPAAGGAVFAFQKIDPVVASELERRVGSPVSFFSGGVLSATSKPELYQSEVLSDLVDSRAFQKVELEGARRTVLESSFGPGSFLSNYAPLSDEKLQPVGILATLAPFHGAGLDAEASLVLSRIYFLCLFVLTGAIVVAFLLANRLARPILDLTVGAERIGAGELGHRIATKAGGEIRALVRSFNLMSEKLAVSEARDRERREYIEAIIRHVGSGVVSFDAHGRIATVNDAARRILADPEAVAGRSGSDLQLPSSALVMDAARPLLEGREEEVVREIELASAESGEPRSIRLVGTPLRDSEGAPQGAVLVFEDLTDLIRSKKITAWAEMARQVAHEIKNPLTPMKLSAQHLQQAWKDRHPKFDKILEESTDTIIDRCEALRRIAIEFSDYARMPGRKMRTEDLGKLVREARRL